MIWINQQKPKIHKLSSVETSKFHFEHTQTLNTQTHTQSEIHICINTNIRIISKHCAEGYYYISARNILAQWIRTVKRQYY